MTIKTFTYRDIRREFEKKYSVFKMKLTTCGGRRFGYCYTKNKKILSFEVYGDKIIIEEIHTDMRAWNGLSWEEFYNEN